ncbi:MAG TPA: hypothetical protein VLR26_16870 [Frankiaceae bacterium]|nr:hypothetical protein [Frankiaceae bacterium]
MPGQRSAVDVQLAAPAPVGWPCTTCGNVVPIHLDACSSCGASFLARLQSEGRHRSDSGTGTMSGLTRLSRSARLGVGVLLGLVLALLVPALMALLG